MKTLTLPRGETKEGVVNANPKGFGFVTTESGESFFVPPPLMRTIVPGDKVSFTVEPGKVPGQFQVNRCWLVSRKESVWQGSAIFEHGNWRLVPDVPCFVRLNIAEVDYLPSDVVLSVRVPSACLLTDSVSVKLERVLGDRNRKQFDQDYALAKFDFVPQFKADALQHASRVPQDIQPDALLNKARKDLRKVPFITIDGDRTMDFDDAVYVEQTDSGFLVQVAIVDVSHYVRPGSLLDAVAKKRATSVYLPGKTVPMLPEALSHGICSLNPEQVRLAVVATLELDSTGAVVSKSFTRATIKSHARLTYRQVADVLEDKSQITVAPALLPLLDSLKSVYGVLKVARKARGVLDFEAPEPVLKVKDDGELTLEFEYRTDAHKLIEELMLLANEAVASEVFERHGKGLFRHQPLPDQEDWVELVAWAKARGHELPEVPSLKAISALVSAAKTVTEQEGSVVEQHVRNIMNSALYDTKDPSHFSLGFNSYAHFTSPVRRYADLCMHRLLLGEGSIDDSIRVVAEHCSERARAARLAERHVWDRLKKTILAREVSKDTELKAHAVIMSRRGLRVVLDQWQCAAFVPAQDLLEEGYNWDMAAEVWTKGGKAIELGEYFTVRWTSLESDQGRLELLAEIA